MADPTDPPAESYLHRGHAESFGAEAVHYDRYRPAPLDALVDQLVALRPSSVLDLACGTGKVAAALAQRGIHVLGVEPDARMAAQAKRHGVEVEIATVESWDDAGRQFDMVTCGNGWHWVEPIEGSAKVAKVLRTGGTFVRLWSYYVFDASVNPHLQQLYAKLAPDADFHGNPHASQKHRESDLPDTFTTGEVRTHRQPCELSADEWVGLVSTYSDHLVLGSERLATLQDALRETLQSLGGTLHAHRETLAQFVLRK